MHAVDFFVEASQQQQIRGEFVERSFFQIPVHNRDKGYFTYALPKDFIPLPADSARYYKSMEVLKQYRSIRPQYLNQDGGLEAIKLFRDWWFRSRLNDGL
jgi:hypothetical protein